MTFASSEPAERGEKGRLNMAEKDHEHEWTRCRGCPTTGPCACSGGWRDWHQHPDGTVHDDTYSTCLQLHATPVLVVAVEGLAETVTWVLGEHRQSNGFYDDAVWRDYACTCGWWSTADQESDYEAHRAGAVVEAIAGQGAT